MVLRHPPNNSLENNFANDREILQSIQSYYIEPSSGWSMCSKNWMVHCSTVVEELISHCFFPQIWMLVIEGFSHLIENICGRVEQLIFMESNLDMEVWLVKWKERYVDKVRQVLHDKNSLWLDRKNFKILMMMMMMTMTTTTTIGMMKMMTMMLMVMVTTDVGGKR